MDIIWNRDKNDLLKLTRNISFEEISEKIINEEYIDIIENPSRKGQEYFIMKIDEYIWLVPFITDKEDTIVLKTAFPSRKFNKQYGGKNGIINLLSRKKKKKIEDELDNYVSLKGKKREKIEKIIEHAKKKSSNKSGE